MPRCATCDKYVKITHFRDFLGHIKQEGLPDVKDMSEAEKQLRLLEMRDSAKRQGENANRLYRESQAQHITIPDYGTDDTEDSSSSDVKPVDLKTYGIIAASIVGLVALLGLSRSLPSKKNTRVPPAPQPTTTDYTGRYQRPEQPDWYTSLYE